METISMGWYIISLAGLIKLFKRVGKLSMILFGQRSDRFCFFGKGDLKRALLISSRDERDACSNLFNGEILMLHYFLINSWVSILAASFLFFSL